jgi:hypothetical protein
MAPHLEAIKETARNPTVIVESQGTPGNFEFINYDIVDSGNQRLKVPVRPLTGKMAGKVAVICSAFFSPTIAGPIVYRRDSGEGGES